MGYLYLLHLRPATQKLLQFPADNHIRIAKIMAPSARWLANHTFSVVDFNVAG
jgi:hypothetical protein